MRAGGGESRRRFGHRGVGYDQVDACVRQDVTHFFGLEKIVDRDHHGAGLQHRKQSGDEFRAVFQPQTHALAGFDLERLMEMRGQLARLREERAVRTLLFAPINGLVANAAARFTPPA